MVFVIFLGMSTPIIVVGLIYFLQKKLKHREILAAIEKGIPVSELNLMKAKKSKDDKADWIKDITSSIAMLMIAAGSGVLFGLMIKWGMPLNPGGILFIVPVIFLSNGTGRLIRGIMRRKFEPEDLQKRQLMTDASCDK
jgi:amino acid transporter